MQSIRFQPVSNLILIPIKVMGIDGNSFRDIEVVLDTGASITSISTNVASGLGYDTLNPERTEEVITGSGIEELAIIEVTALTAIGQTVENIDVMCLDLHPEIHAEGVLGLNFC